MKKRKRFISIKTKLLSIILPVVIVIMIVLTSLSYNVSKGVIQSNAQELLETSVKGQAAQIEAWLNQNLTSFQVEKRALEQMEFDEGQLQAYLNAYQGFDSNYPNGISLADTSGRIYQASTTQKVDLREPDENGNYVNNGNFSSDEDWADNEGWAFYTDLGGEAEVETADGAAVIHTKAEGTEDYSIQLVQPNIPMKKGATYQLSFDAYADTDRSMKVGISAPDHDYIRYFGDETVEVTATEQTFTYEFTMPEDDDSNGRLDFNLGAAGSTADICIRNVSIVKTDEPAGEPDEDSSQKVDVMELPWFRDGMTRVNMGFTDAYTNENGEQVISASGMLQVDSDDVYVLSAELSLDTVSIYVNSFVEMNGAESFLVNEKDLTILASRDTSLISRNINELDDDFMKGVAQRISSNELDMAEISGNISVFREVKGTDWMLVSFIPSKTVYQDLDRVRNIMALVGIISVLILTVLMERIVHIVIRPVKKLTNVIKSMTDGDFTVRSYTKSNDEIGAMGRCVEKFIDTMRSMISSINGVSDTLHEQADSSRDVSGQMFSASKMQNQSMKELNQTIENLSISVSGIAESATTLAGVVADTKKNGDGVNSKMQETVDVSRKGKQAMQEVSEAMCSINSSVQKLQSAIEEVDRASEEITNITKVIGSIAEETNLLSLNASIEAARAGEAGRGFAVVASEIGKLAQTSVGSVQDIDKLVMEIKTSIGDVVNQANDSVENINSSSVLIQNAAETFDVIFGNIAVVDELVQGMIQKVIHVESVAVDVAAISEEQAASSQEILNSSDILVKQANNLIANSETVAKESEDLTASAEELAAQMGNFKIQG